MTITRFEDIEEWKKARVLSRQIYQSSSDGAFNRDFALRNQIRGAAVSVMSNIAEGFERDGNKEFLQFLSIAKGSCGEVRSQLYVALDNGFINQAQFNELYNLAQQTGRLTGGFMGYLRNSELRGRKKITPLQAKQETPRPKRAARPPKPGTRNPERGTNSPYE